MSTKLTRAQDLYVIERDDLYGFSDKSGKPLIPPKYGAAKPFSEGLAAVYENGNWGFIDSTGKTKIEPDFWDADDFSDGLAAIRKGGWGYIDQTGTIVVQPRYLRARRFSEDAAPVKAETGWLFIDKAGRPVPNLSGFEDAMNFSAGLAAVQVGGKWRFITHEGKKKFDLEFTKVSNFNEDLAAVQEEENGKYGFIDSLGHYAIRPVFDVAMPFSEGLAAVRLNNRWGYVNKSGEMQIPNNYPFFAEEFAGGLAVVSDPVHGAKMYINGDGKPQFFKSNEPPDTERGGYAACSLKLSSVPPGAEVYLIPAYIWDQGVRGRPAPSQLKAENLKAYLDEHFEFQVKEGQTDVEVRYVVEQTDVALFLLGGDMQRRWVDLRIGENSASVSFEHK
jgi:WG containing repeat